jgi:hypothetical protein
LFKGIVSRDLHILFFVSIDWSEGFYTCEACLFAFKISISCRIFRFSLLGIVSLPCEWRWAIRLSAATRTFVAPYWESTTAHKQRLFWRNNFEDGHCPSPGLFTAPYLEFPELALISYVKPIEKILPLSPGLGQGKLTTLSCEN